MAITNDSQTQIITGTRLPPQNLDAEVSVLGSLLLDQDAIVKMADLVTPEDFYDRRHQVIYEAILVLFEKRQALDILTVTSRLDDTNKLEAAGGASYLATLVNSVATATNVVHHASLVKEKAMLRRLITAANDISQLGYREGEDIDVVLDKAEQTLFSVSQKFLKQNFVGIRSVLTQTFERINELTEHKGQLRGVPTGFKVLDNVLAGFQKSDLIILAARPSIGKTSLALNFAEHVAVESKKNVGIFSLEMSADQLTDRLLCVLGGIDAWRLRTGNLTDADFGRLHEAMGKLAEANIFIDDSPFVNVMEMRARARRLQMEHGLDFLIVDYLQLMEGTGALASADNRVQEVSYISRSLKSLARELNIPILALSQLSRAVEQRTPKIPQLADLRESGCLTGDTLIEMADSGEQVPIKSLVGKSNFAVWGLNDQWQITQYQASRAFSSGRKPVFQIIFRSGKSIQASANHKFRTYTGWQRLDELTKGQRLATPRQYQYQLMDNPDFTDDLLVFLAHMIGDGCYVPHQPIHYTSQNQANIEVVSGVAQRAFGITSRIVSQQSWYHCYLPSPYRLARGIYHPFHAWLKQHGLSLSHSYSKELPRALLSCSDRQLILFVKHLWATDGCLHLATNGVKLYYATTSLSLAKQLSHLLLRLGVRSTLRKVRQRHGGVEYRPNYHVDISGKDNQLIFLRHIGIFGVRGQLIPRCVELLERQVANPNVDALDNTIWSAVIEPVKVAVGVSWRDLSAGINTAYSGSSLMKAGVSRQRLLKVASYLDSSSLRQLAESDVYWDEIVDIQPLGVEEVFDITVNEVHNFIANDVIVHNSIEQDADVVMFIYRDEVYNPDSDKKNIAEIIIAKHRNGPTGRVNLFFKVDQTKFLDIDTAHYEASPAASGVGVSSDQDISATGEF